jgi:hypothetical protein
MLRLLLVTLTLGRLLLPPGICVCKLTAPASRLLILLLRAKPPALPANPSNEPEEDHAPGCPASILSTGMYVKPSEVPTRPALTFDHPLRPGLLESTAIVVPPSQSQQRWEPLESWQAPPDDPVYLTTCSLLI